MVFDEALTNPDASLYTDEGPVQVVTLDSVLPHLRDLVAQVAASNPTQLRSPPAQPPILMKLDVEGCEPMVLQGAQELLAEFKVGAIFLEVSASVWAKNGCSAVALARAFFALGYRGMARDGNPLLSEEQ